MLCNTLHRQFSNKCILDKGLCRGEDPLIQLSTLTSHFAFLQTFCVIGQPQE